VVSDSRLPKKANVIASYPSAGIAAPVITTWINIAVLIVIFTTAYHKKGLRN